MSRLRESPPALHAEGRAFWGTGWGALVWLEGRLRPGMATLETGAGATTIVFAAGGTRHEAITPAEDEVERIREECERLGVSLDLVDFHLGPSEEVLPRLVPRPLDLVLVGGADGFPYPILDWWYLAPRLRLEATFLSMLLTTRRRARSSSICVRTPRGVCETSSGTAQSSLKRWRRRHRGRCLPVTARSVASALVSAAVTARACASRHRFFTTRAGLAAVALARAHAGWLWRRRR